MKHKLLLLLAILAMAVSASAENYILYTSKDGKVVEPNKANVFGATITSNTYENGQGKIVFDGEVTSIGEDAFSECTSLTSVTIPSSLTAIGIAAFGFCSGLTVVTIPNSVIEIGEMAFYKCTSLTSVEIPNSVTSIGAYAFKYCSGLTSVTIPNSVTSINSFTFNSCSALTSVTIPESVKTIELSAFGNCTSLTSVTIPKSVKSIELSAFSDCTSLTSVTVENDNPANISLGSDVFYNVPTNTCVLCVPYNTKCLYAVADQWSAFKNIKTLVALADGESYTGNEDMVDIDITYTRTFSITDWQPLYAPFNMSYDEWSSHGTVAELACVHVYEDGKTAIEFVTVNSGNLLPNVPYVIKPTETGEVTFACTEKQIKAAPAEGEKYISCSSPRYIFKLYGNYQPISASTLAGYGDPLYNGAYVMTADNKFAHASDGTELKPYRFYITREKNPNGYWGAPARHNMPAATGGDTDVIYFMVDGQVTGILSVSKDSTDDVKVYDLGGIQTRNPHDGVFIKNGKKVYVK